MANLTQTPLWSNHRSLPPRPSVCKHLKCRCYISGTSLPTDISIRAYLLGGLINVWCIVSCIFLPSASGLAVLFLLRILTSLTDPLWKVSELYTLLLPTATLDFPPFSSSHSEMSASLLLPGVSPGPWWNSAPLTLLAAYHLPSWVLEWCCVSCGEYPPLPGYMLSSVGSHLWSLSISKVSWTPHSQYCCAPLWRIGWDLEVPSRVSRCPNLLCCPRSPNQRHTSTCVLLPGISCSWGRL